MEKTLRKIAVIVAIAAVLYAVFPLFGPRYIPTHDGEYHIIRIVEFSKMLRSGVLIPRWAPDLNSGYGIPIFNFHYPLPNYIGSLVRVVTQDAVYAFQASMGLGYVALAVGAFLWLSVLFGVFPGLIGAVTAAFVPYVFVDMYVRGSIGELWATAFLFFALYLIEKKRYAWFAFAFGLLILSHNILAMLFTPFILGYAIIRNKKAVKWMVGGLGLSAFFWLPALLEQKYVVGLNTVNFREHFVRLYELIIPSWGTQFSGTGALGNKISFQVGIVPIAVIIVSILSARKRSILSHFMFDVLVLCLFFMLPVSRPIWEAITPLQLIQYPWRLLSFVVPIAGFFAASWVAGMKVKWVGIVIALVAVLFSASYARPVQYEPRSEAYYLARPNFTDGTSSMGNSFSTIWTGWKDTRAILDYRGSYLDRVYNINVLTAGDTAIPVLYFPGWRAWVDGVEAPITYQTDGTIHVPVPEGDHAVRVRFTDTPVRTASQAVSGVSLVILLALGILAL